MQKISTDKVVANATKVDTVKKTVLKHHSTTQKTLGRFEMDTTFDFSKCTIEQLLELASRDALIKHQVDIRNCKTEAEIKSLKKVVDMSEVSTRERVSPYEKARRASVGLDEAQKLELIKVLQGK